MSNIKHWPINPNNSITSSYGYRTFDNSFHDGLDFAAYLGEPIYAAHEGVLHNKFDPGGYGQYIEISNGYTVTQYGHVSKMYYFPDGSYVSPGVVIAGAGNEGVGTGVHLHFRVREANVSVDPSIWLNNAVFSPLVENTVIYDESTVEGQIYIWCSSQGLTNASTAAVLGTIEAESAFKPWIVEGGGTDLSVIDDVRYSGIGVLQWSFERREALLNYAAKTMRPWQDMTVQLEFMLIEIEAQQRYIDMWTRMKAYNAVTVANTDFNATFIRPGVYGERDAMALKWYDRIMAGEFGTTSQPIPNKFKFIQAIPSFI